MEKYSSNKRKFSRHRLSWRQWVC